MAKGKCRVIPHLTKAIAGVWEWNNGVIVFLSPLVSTSFLVCVVCLKHGHEEKGCHSYKFDIKLLRREERKQIWCLPLLLYYNCHALRFPKLTKNQITICCCEAFFDCSSTGARDKTSVKKSQFRLVFFSLISSWWAQLLVISTMRLLRTLEEEDSFQGKIGTNKRFKRRD